jgi:hypothetical protein
MTLRAILHPRAIHRRLPEIVGDVGMAVGALGPQVQVERVGDCDLQWVETESDSIVPLSDPLVALDTVGGDALRLGGEPFPIPLVDDLSRFGMAVGAGHHGKTGMDL